MSRTVRRLLLVSTAAVAMAVAAGSTAEAQQVAVPPLSDLVGKWVSANNPDNLLFFKIGEAESPSNPADLTVEDQNGRAWAVDPDIPYRSRGSIWLSRPPAAAEMSRRYPEWARKRIEGQLLWRLRLIAAPEKPGRIEGLFVDYSCKLELTGNFYEGYARVVGPHKDADNRVLEDGAEVTIPDGEQTREGQPARLTKVWYEPPQIDNGMIFRWRDPAASDERLRASANDVLSELNAALVDTTTYKYYRQLAASVAKSILYAGAFYGGATAALEPAAAQGIARQFAGGLLGNLIENGVLDAIKGDPIGRDLFVRSLASTASSMLVGRLVAVDVEPADAISEKLAEEIGESLYGLYDEHQRPRTTEPSRQTRTQFTAAEIGDLLTRQYANQCRFQMAPVKLGRGIGGIIVADRALHAAQILLYVPARRGRDSAVVTGRFSYATDDGSPMPLLIPILLDVVHN